MDRRRRYAFIGPLLLLAVVAAGCAGTATIGGSDSASPLAPTARDSAETPAAGTGSVVADAACSDEDRASQDEAADSCKCAPATFIEGEVGSGRETQVLVITTPPEPGQLVAEIVDSPTVNLSARLAPESTLCPTSVTTVAELMEYVDQVVVEHVEPGTLLDSRQLSGNFDFVSTGGEGPSADPLEDAVGRRLADEVLAFRYVGIRPRGVEDPSIRGVIDRSVDAGHGVVGSAVYLRIGEMFWWRPTEGQEQYWVGASVDSADDAFGSNTVMPTEPTTMLTEILDEVVASGDVHVADIGSAGTRWRVDVDADAMAQLVAWPPFYGESVPSPGSASTGIRVPAVLGVNARGELMTIDVDLSSWAVEALGLDSRTASAVSRIIVRFDSGDPVADLEHPCDDPRSEVRGDVPVQVCECPIGLVDQASGHPDSVGLELVLAAAVDIEAGSVVADLEPRDDYFVHTSEPVVLRCSTTLSSDYGLRLLGEYRFTTDVPAGTYIDRRQLELVDGGS